MRRSSLFTLAYVALVGAAGPLAACAATNSASTSAATSASARSATASAETGVTYTDMQVQNFVAARNEIAALPAAQQSDQAQVGAILQRHNLAPDVFNAIQTRSQTDTALANRIAAINVGANFTDAQLQGFVRASAQIDPLNRQLATATGDQRQQIAAQIRTLLEQNNLDLQTYNVIAARSQSDPQLAARLNAIRTAAQPQSPSG
jgi:hypothetical protein